MGVKPVYGSRRIHLDFHTSPAIEKVAENFNAEYFANTLKEANVNSITIFGKCLHGMCYYPTKIGKMHPGLKIDLLGEEIKACSKLDISTLIYLSAMWDDYAASNHQEWLQITKDGKLGGRHPLKTNGFREVCLNSEYIDYFLAILEEIIDNYKVNGFFIDMVKQDLELNIGCICNNCLKSMEKLGLSPIKDEDLKKHSKIIEQNFVKKVSNLVRSKIKDPVLIFNCRNNLMIDKFFSLRTELPYISHIEVESLPTATLDGELLWGYDYFPKVVNFFRTLNIKTAVMTGIFHKGWGDFGSIKNKPALEYECFRGLANGSTCCIGDQPNPDVILDKERYKRIGEVYKSLKEKEEWCIDAEPMREVGVIFSEENETGNFVVNYTDYGALRILLEDKRQFQFLDRENDLNNYELIILPDKIETDSEFLEKLERYIKNGGKVLISGSSMIDLNNNKFLLSEIGLDFLGAFDYETPYIKLENSINKDIEDMEYVVYDGGIKIKPKSNNIEVLAKFWYPYFNRNFKHFCSHMQSPPLRESEFPAIIKNNNLVYIAFPIFKSYKINASLIYKKIIKNCLNLLLPKPIIKSDLPSTAEVSVLKQGSRLIIHLLHYIPIRRGQSIEVIEDNIPLYSKTIFIKCGFKPSKVYSAPDKRTLDYSRDDDYLKIEIPEIDGHKIIVIEKL